MQIVNEKLDIDEILEKKFNNIKSKIEIGSIITLTNINIAYTEPHRLEIKGTTVALQLM